ncbi:nuclear valosin-containing protein-like isoform X2 [Anopheles moucheti]|uniref:nuclear valosin-containing protein-like isoform X2 n=1 Tax=Anopheles moucheti TaxID=186751 RepID=UPI0022F0D64D|nr:nuclear valosin-containing protein-like isoform X2 [Anopheles moucheti]
MHRKASPFPYDPMIIPRVKQYLEENVHQTYVDTGVMARELQQRYREYHRRKSNPFRLLVEEAYRTVLHSYGLDSNATSEAEDDAGSDVELMDEGTQRNQMSNTLTNMYMNNRNRAAPSQAVPPDQSGTGADGVAIDIISSDEETRGATNAAEAVAGEFVARNKHVTVTKLTRVNKAREDDSSNGSVESGVNASEKSQPELKRRRLEIANARGPMQNCTNGQMNRVTKPNNVSKQPNKADQTNQTTGTPTTAASGQRMKKFRKEIVSRMSDITFQDVGGMDKVLKHLCELLLHVKHPEIYRHIGLPPPRGFLLHGPPGSGKTLLARAIAGQLNICLIEIPATELVAGVSGESEERIRDVFEQAASLAPCVLFIDEIDAISSNRINAQKDMERRIVAQLLSSMDALGAQDGGEGVIVIGATNRADALDPALRRIGRFDQEISLGIPDRTARTQILRIICRKLKIGDTIDYGELAKLTPGYVGADLLALATRAANNAIKRLFTKQEWKMLENVTAESTDEDVVAIDDEPDEVVNLDDEKDDPKEAEIKPSEETDKMDVPKAIESTSEDSKTETEQGVAAADSTQITEPTAVVQQPEVTQEKESTSETNAEKMDAEQIPTVSTEATVKEGENVETVEQEDHQMEEKTSDNQSASVEEPTVQPAVVESTMEADSVIQPKVDRQQELTLEQMLQLLLNQQNALPAADLEGLCIERDDFMESLKTVQPSAKREGFITVPDVTWNDIGSLGDIREELKLAILAPVKFPQRLKLLGLNAPSGVLLCGPPGCGKTLLAKAVANEAGINFISVKGPELLNMYVGESERAVRQCFQRARNSAPCVIFFDEFDSLCPKRSDTAESSAGSRVVNQLLTEMDGIEERKGVFLMAATNRPDIVDPAVLRPGRLDKILYVGLPAQDDRVDILRALTKNRSQPPLADDVEFEKVAELTEGYTGADLAGLVRQASLQTLKDSIVASGDEERVGESGHQQIDEELNNMVVRFEHFTQAIRNTKPSVNAEDKKHYEKLRHKYGVNVLV